MTESCCCPTEAGNQVCDLPAQDFERKSHPEGLCPECNQKGKPVESQTIKSMLTISLRELHDTDYFFCRTETCPVAYFSADGTQTFTRAQVRERVFQKEPRSKDVTICYCFGHTVGNIIDSTPKKQNAIVNDINAGIKTGQCACDLRNPQGSCCLGNVRGLIKTLQVSAA